MLGAGRLGLYNSNPVDEGFSRTAKTVTLGTDHSYDTGTYKFGSASLLNELADYKNTFTEAHTDFQIESGDDFTVEFWVYPFNLAGDSRPLLILMDDIGTTNPSGLGGGDFCIAVMIKSGGVNGDYVSCYIPNGSGGVSYVHFGTFTSTIQTSQWQHIAVCRSSGVMRGFINGEEGSQTFPTSGTDNRTLVQTTGNTPPRLWLGNSPASGETNRFKGWIDDVRLTRSALYTADFVPSTSALVNETDTVLLLHLDSNTDDDNTST